MDRPFAWEPAVSHGGRTGAVRRAPFRHSSVLPDDSPDTVSKTEVNALHLGAKPSDATREAKGLVPCGKRAQPRVRRRGGACRVRVPI